MIDLLNPGSVRKPLEVRWSRKARNFYVDNLFMVDCEELDDLQAVLEEGVFYKIIFLQTLTKFNEVPVNQL